jgi:hypothetical protein
MRISQKKIADCAEKIGRGPLDAFQTCIWKAHRIKMTGPVTMKMSRERGQLNRAMFDYLAAH